MNDKVFFAALKLLRELDNAAYDIWDTPSGPVLAHEVGYTLYPVTGTGSHASAGGVYLAVRRLLAARA